MVHMHVAKMTWAFAGIQDMSGIDGIFDEVPYGIRPLEPAM